MRGESSRKFEKFEMEKLFLRVEIRNVFFRAFLREVVLKRRHINWAYLFRGQAQKRAATVS